MSNPQDEDREVLDIEEIMDEIRQGIALRQQRGELTEPELAGYRPFHEIPWDLAESQKELNARWDKIHEPFEAKSRTPVLGRLWAAIRQSIHGEVRAYLDPMIWRQTELNAAIVRSLNALVRELYGGPLAKSLRALNLEVYSLRKELQALKERLRDQERNAGRKRDE